VKSVEERPIEEPIYFFPLNCNKLQMHYIAIHNQVLRQSCRVARISCAEMAKLKLRLDAQRIEAKSALR